jgi:hypothetical protein
LVALRRISREKNMNKGSGDVQDPGLLGADYPSKLGYTARMVGKLLELGQS